MAIYYNPHYSAPITCLIVALVLCAMQRIRNWTQSGLFLSRAVPVACVLAFGIRLAAAPLKIAKSPYSTYYWYEYSEIHSKDWFERAAIQNQLKNELGDHLVIVRYGFKHELTPDWVYNDADIDHSRIIWARDMGPTQNSELIKYFKERQVWLIEPDKVPVKLSSYPD